MGLDPRYGGGYGTTAAPSAPPTPCEEPPAYTPRGRYATTGTPRLLPFRAPGSSPSRSSRSSSSSALPSSSRPAPRYNDSEDWGGASQREQEEAFALLPRQSSGQYASVESAAVPTGDAARAMNAPGGYLGVAKLLVGVYAILMGAMIYTNGGVRAPSLPPSPISLPVRAHMRARGCRSFPPLSDKTVVVRLTFQRL